MSFIDEWWAERRNALKMARYEAELADAGIPAWYTTATGEPTHHPWSAVAGARDRLPALINLDKLHRRVYKLLGVPL